MNHPSAERIFHTARSKRDDGERAAYLEGACGADVALRNKVEALLRADREARTFLEERDPAATAEVAGAERVGTVIDRYKLLQPIGEGGFGTVWMTEQREPVKRRVALKIIKLGMDTRQVIARFEAERQALAMMDHPNIAKVLDAGATAQGRPYFVMELVRGDAITTYCDREQLDTRARLRLFMEVCRAVQHAHQKGIIHRDIKPNNVLVTLHDGVPVPKIIDFGIAKATHAELTERTLFTEHRQLIGTPAYMSPEQAELSGLDVDTRCDVYALGVLLYELLTGAPPFSIRELREAGYDEMLRIIREQQPLKPSTRIDTLGGDAGTIAALRRTDRQHLGATLRGDLDWIVMKCLEKERGRRYETASGLALEIERFLNDEPVSASPPSAYYRLTKFVRRRRALVAAGVAVVLTLLLGIAGTTAGYVEALHLQDRARHEAQLLRTLNDFYAAMLISADPARTHLFVGVPEQTDPHFVAPGQGSVHITVADMLRGALEHVDTTFAGHPDLEAATLEQLATTLMGLGHYGPTVDAFAQAARLRAVRLGATAPATLGVQLKLGLARLGSGAAQAAAEQLRRTYDTARATLGPDHPLTLNAATCLASSLVLNNAPDASRALLEDTVARQRAVLGADHPHTLWSMLEWAAACCWQGRAAEAERLARAVLEAQPRDLPDGVLQLKARALVGFALTQQDGGAEEAMTLLPPTVAELEEILGSGHLFTNMARMGLARALPHTPEHAARRIAILERVRAASIARAGMASAWTFVPTRDLAAALIEAGRTEDGVQMMRAQLVRYEQQLGADDPWTARCRSALQDMLDGLPAGAEPPDTP